MQRWFAVALLTGMVLSPAAAGAQQPETLPGPTAALKLDNPTGGLPPAPSPDTSTIFGGAIRSVDTLRDQFMLHVYGQRPMKVLYDERTQVFRDGVKIPVHDLGAADHASVQTALDGTHIFAISIHILSQIPTGSFRGMILSYDRDSGVLALDASPAPPFKVVVAVNATIRREGQTAFTAQPSGPWDLRRGALVSVTFAPNGEGQVIANQVQVFAVPGASFIFSGDVTALDMADGTLTLVDPRDGKSYRLHFYPGQVSSGQTLHIGAQVRITASYNGGSYMASDISIY